MSHPASSWPTSWSNRTARIGLVLAAVVLMGQSCNLSFGDSTPADGGVFRSDDHARKWQHKVFVGRDGNRTLSIREVSVMSFAFDPSDSRRIFIGTQGQGVWKTSNSGDRWEATSLRSGTYRCISFDPVDSQIVYTAAGTTVLKSSDGGKGWQAVYTEAQPGHLVRCVIVDPVQGNLVWAVTSGGKILLSQDAGTTWTLVQTIPPFEPRRLFIPPDGSQQLYVFTADRGIFHLSGLGTALADISAPLIDFPGSNDIRAVTITGWPNSRWYLGTARGLLISTDLGVTWAEIQTLVTPKSIAIQNVAVNVEDPTELFITVGTSLHRTNDGGATWEVTTLPTTRIVTLLTIDPQDGDRFYFSTIAPPKK